MSRKLVDAIFSFISPAIYVPFTTNVVHNIVVLLRTEECEILIGEKSVTK